MGKVKDTSRIIYKLEKPVIVHENGLPLPWVHYSVGGKAFVGFSENKDGEVFFCECCKPALINYLKLREKEGITPKFRNMRWYYTMETYLPIFPERFLEKFGEEEIDIKDVYPRIPFKPGLCHRCNQKMPTVILAYAGFSTFMEHYGWYVDLKYLELGYLHGDIMLDSFPAELREMVSEMQYYSKIWNEETSKPLKEWNVERMQEADKKGEKIGRRFHNIVENMVREEFGYKKVGEHWVTETALYHLVCQVMPGKKVIFHYRPQILEGLELDIFIPDLNVGIEYQGIQHFKPLDVWGGEAALKKTQEHDSRKKRLCKENEIDLIEFFYSDEISEPLVRERLKKYLE